MQTIGERLEDARKRKGISIREAAEATKIRGDYLQKFEGNQFDIDLAGIYLRGFLRNYALFLKLPPDRIIDDFDALGRADTRPHAPSREVYGRMELSIASAEDRVEHTAAAAGDSSPRPKSPLRGHDNLPKAPPIDPALLYKGGIALVAVLILVLIIWAAKSIMGGSSSSSAEARSPAAAVAERTFTLVAVDPVRVSVILKNGGRVLLPETTLERDDRRTVPFPGSVIVRADVGANVQFDSNGRRLGIPAGYNQVQLDPPQQ
jgi:cytoskeleton protein RodZ